MVGMVRSSSLYRETGRCESRLCLVLVAESKKRNVVTKERDEKLGGF
jgi:hypothetical protein